MSGGGMTVTDRSAQDFAAWVQPHLPAMSRFAGRLVPSADRDDVVQESLVRAWRRWSTFDAERGAPLGWLLSIVADQGRRHRTRSRRPVLAAEESPAGTAPADLDLERALARLTDRQRTAVDLHYFVDLDVATTAEVMGCAPGTVKATLHQARARLRAMLGDPWGDEDG